MTANTFDNWGFFCFTQKWISDNIPPIDDFDSPIFNHDNYNDNIYSNYEDIMHLEHEYEIHDKNRFYLNSFQLLNNEIDYTTIGYITSSENDYHTDRSDNTDDDFE